MDSSDLGLICSVNGNAKSVFGFKNPILDFLKETHPYVTAFLSLTRKTKLAISHALFYTSTSIYSSVEYSISVNTVQKYVSKKKMYM